MADFSIAVNKTLRAEGGFSLNPATGECVNWGITVWFLRSIRVLYGQGRRADDREIAFVRSITREYAISLYRKYFWDINRLDQVRDQGVAEKIFDLAVNMGTGGIHSGEVVDGAVTLLQKALNSLKIARIAPLLVDGRLGAKTIAAVNAADPLILLSAYRALAADRYRALARANPALAPDLPGWLDRLAV